MMVHKLAITSHWIFFELIELEVRDHDEESYRFVYMKEKERKN